MPGERVPATMRRCQLRGTPSLVLLDRKGCLRLHHLERVEDLESGLMLGRLLGGDKSMSTTTNQDSGVDNIKARPQLHKT